MSLFASLLALDVPRPVITVEYLTECQKRPAARFNKDAPCMTMYEAWRAVQNVSRPFRNHWEDIECPEPQAKPRTCSEKDKQSTPHVFKYPVEMIRRSTSGCTPTEQSLPQSLPNSDTGGKSLPKSSDHKETSESNGLPPTHKSAEPCILRPVRVFPPTASPVLLSLIDQPSLPHLGGPEYRAFNQALEDEGIDGGWWHWARSRRQTWIVDKRTNVWRRMKGKGFSYATIAAVSGGYHHTTIIHALRTPASKPASTPSDGGGSSHPEATLPLDQPAPV